MKKTHYINNDFINTRLDRWIRKNIYNIPQSLIEKSLRNGKIKVNNKKKKSSYKLQLNDEIITQLQKVTKKPFINLLNRKNLEPMKFL